MVMQIAGDSVPILQKGEALLVASTVASSMPLWTNCSSRPSVPITPKAAYFAPETSLAASTMRRSEDVAGM